MKYPPKAYTRDERKQQVEDQFNVWYSKGYTEPKTQGRIARALGMTPSSKFRDLLLEMVKEGKLICDPPLSEGGNTVRYYSLVSTLIADKFYRREIRINRRGVNVAQLEMFQS
jgi:hypothetical protein